MCDGNGQDDAARPHPRARQVLLAARPPRLRRPGRAGRADGARAGRRKEVAHEGGNARGHRRLPIITWPPRHPGRHLDLVHPRRLLGGLGRRLGVHPAELRHRRGARRALRPLRRAAVGDRDLLRRESRRHRTDPPLVLSAHEARDERLARVGARSGGIRHHGCGPGRSRVGLHRVRDRRPSLLRLALSWPQSRIDDVAHGRRAARRLLRGAGRARLAAGSVAGVLLEGRFAHVRQWPRHRPVPRERTRAADALAERARFPRRGCHGDDQPRPRRHHGNVRRVPRRRATHRLPARRFLGFCHRDDRYLLAFVPLDLDRRADPCSLPDESKCAGLHQRRIRRRHRHHPRCLRLAREDRHRRLAHCAGGAREPRRSVPLEG